MVTSVQYKQLCSLCEEWTEESCDYCDVPVCDACFDGHEQDCDLFEDV